MNKKTAYAFVFLFTALACYWGHCFYNGPFRIAMSVAGVSIPYIGTKIVLNSYGDGIDGADYYFLLKRNENTLYICKSGERLHVANYGDDARYIRNALGGDLSYFGIGVASARQIYKINGGSFFNMICDGAYIYIRYSSR